MSREFNGTTSKITLADDALITNMGPMSFSAFVFTRGAGENSFGRLFEKGSLRFFLRTASTPTTTRAITFSVPFTTTNLDKFAVDNTPSLNEWNCIQVTWDGGTAHANVHTYIDGAEISYNAGSTNASGSRVSDAGSDFIIGNNSGQTRTYDGDITHVQIFDRVLDLNELNNIRLFPGSETKGLLRYLPLGGSSSPEPDYSGFKGHGLVTSSNRSGLNPQIFKEPFSRFRVPNSFRMGVFPTDLYHRQMIDSFGLGKAPAVAGTVVPIFDHHYRMARSA